MIHTSVANGCFDILHAGHYQFLEYCHNFIENNHLAVFLDSDRKVAEDKGSIRPFFSFSQRKRALLDTGLVKCVIGFDSDEELEQLYDFTRPDILFKGEDWKDKHIVGRRGAKKIVFVPRTINISTTEIYNKIKGKTEYEKEGFGYW